MKSPPGVNQEGFFLGLNIGGDQKSPVSSLKRASSGIEILIFLCLLSARVQTIATPVTAGATLPGLVKTFSAPLHPQQLIQKPKYKYLFWSIFVSDDTAIDLAFDLYKQKIKIMYSSSSSYQRALDLFTESVIKPDIELRANAASKNCYSELMEIRQHCLTYLNTLKEIHQIELADESDDIEAVKIVSTKIDSMEMVFSHGEMM